LQLRIASEAASKARQGLTQFISNQDVLLVLAQLVHLVHVAESGLIEATGEEALKARRGSM
jgi:hypothetical protein